MAGVQRRLIRHPRVYRCADSGVYPFGFRSTVRCSLRISDLRIANEKAKSLQTEGAGRFLLRVSNYLEAAFALVEASRSTGRSPSLRRRADLFPYNPRALAVQGALSGAILRKHMTRAVLRRCRLVVTTLTICVNAVMAQEPESATLRKVRDTGVVTLGHRTVSAPFSYLDARRRPIGYSMDICQRVVEAIRLRLGQPEIEVRLVPVTSATRLPMLAIGTVDLECGVTTHTAERQKSVAFSVTTFVAASRLLSKKSAEIFTIDDLRGQSVATTLSTTSIQYLTAVNQSRGLDMRIHAGADDQDAFLMVRNDHAVAFAMDDVLLRGVLASAPDAASYRISDEALTTEPYAIGIVPNDPVFKQLVDGVIVGLYRSGEIHDIYKKWFESTVPLRNINLRMPMSEQLKRVIVQPTDSPDPAAYR